jgi:hypothetical protein
MGFIKRFDAQLLGYDFVNKEFLPEGKDEHYIRYQQKEKNGFRKLTGQEVDMLVRNGNMSDNWDTVLVDDPFNPGLVRNCIFYGLVRIGKLEPQCLEYHDLRLPVGLYNSMIISSDIGDNVAIHNVGYLSHYILDSESMLFNIDEMETSNKSKFGNGIIKDGETEAQRLWMEICNENGGRKVLPFDGMLTSDAYLWSKFRDDKELMRRFQEITENAYSPKRGFYGRVGKGCVIKNTSSIKDVNIGDSTYIKGANKLKNLTINSSEDSPTQIGEGVELVNGIVGTGCKVFYGVKAVRFVMGVNSSLKYGARLINSFLGENATISCCEVLNSLIYPSHEQHHNNSFLIASCIQGQSNIAAGATLGSNHTSRANDGEIIAKRGFWAGLSTSIKHNSRFGSFTLLTKANYLHSISIDLPFALVANNESENWLEIIPAYWWRYNMYALERNAWKFVMRDKREKIGQKFEYGYLAPDSVSEILKAIDMLYRWIAEEVEPNAISHHRAIAEKAIAEGYNPASILVSSEGIEASSRKVLVKKPVLALAAYQEMVKYYALTSFIDYMMGNRVGLEGILSLDSDGIDRCWMNVGGQIIKCSFIEELKQKVKKNELNSWDEIHAAYRSQDDCYVTDKARYAKYALSHILGQELSLDSLLHLADDGVTIAQMVKERVYQSRLKDYNDPFRRMVYDSAEEMEAVVGGINDNDFIAHSEAVYQKTLSNVKALFAKIKMV